jgi:hypothetical protein
MKKYSLMLVLAGWMLSSCNQSREIHGPLRSGWDARRQGRLQRMFWEL